MLRLPFIIITFLFFTHSSNANHFTGGELRYEYIGAPNIYSIKLTLYKTCESGAIDFPSFINVFAESKQLNQRLNKNLARVLNDTLQPYCAGTLTTCDNLSSDYPGYLVASYTDTIKMPPTGTDWMFIFSNSNRNFGITNLSGASGQSFYIDAPIKIAHNNTSALIPDYPPHVLFVNDSISVPLTAIDADGDSITYNLFAPLSAATSSIPYSPGYNVQLPFGAGGLCYIDADNNLVLKSPVTGKFTLALKINEYRNGLYIGYTMRDFIIICKAVNAGDLTIPQPTSRKNMVTYTCPGRKNTLNFNFTDPEVTDFVTIDIQPPALAGWSFNSSITNGVGSATGTLSWTTPPSADPAVLKSIDINVHVKDDACKLIGSATYVYKVILRDCSADSVWPGDANSDKVVDLYDPLAVALAYGDTGSKRTNATTNWAAEHCDYWEGFFLDNIDKKHADCNGDGIVNASDLGAITTNYGKVHAKGTPQHKGTAGPDLYFDHSGIKAHPDSTVTIKVLLGSGASPVSKLYGLATNILVDGLPLASPPAISYSSTWLGNSSNTLSFTKDVAPTSIDWAYARTNHKDTNGQGQLANLTFKIPASTPNGTLVTMSYSKTLLIDYEGTEILDYNTQVDTFYVWDAPTAISNIQDGISHTSLYPNPSSGTVTISWYSVERQELAITITDLTGKALIIQQVPAGTGNRSVTLQTEKLSPGMYLVNVKTTEGSDTHTMKWIKK